MDRKHRLPMELAKLCKDAEEKEKLIQNILQALPVLKLYEDIIEKKIAKLEDTKEADYEKPSWSALQADRNGQKRMARDILKLFPRPEGEK